MNTSRLPTAVRKFATERTYAPKISVSPIQPTTTSAEPRLVQRTRRCSSGPQRTISSNANAMRTTAAGQRRIRIGMLQLPETCPAQTIAIAPSTATRTRIARPHERGKRIQNGRVSGVS
jgi:hypothetical protein